MTTPFTSSSSSFSGFRFIPLLFIPLAITFTACSSGSDQTGQITESAQPVTIPADATPMERVDLWINANEYESALAWLAEQDQQDSTIRFLLEKTWLNYGLHNMSTFDVSNMRTQMNNALRCFAEVLEVNPQNQMAIDQIRQILGVYRTMPDRGPEADVVERLQGLGFTI